MQIKNLRVRGRAVQRPIRPQTFACPPPRSENALPVFQALLDAVVALFAKTLKIVLVIEQRLIAPVWLDMVANKFTCVCFYPSAHSTCEHCFC